MSFLPDKARTTYSRMLDAIKGIQPNFAPDTFMGDFELALHRSKEMPFRQHIYEDVYFILRSASTEK